MKSLRTVIIDDEQKARNTISAMIQKHCPEVEEVGYGYDVRSGIQVIKEKKPDLVLLDIQMPDGSGFDLIDQLNDISFGIIFITAYQEYAIKAFEFSALHYLLKPLDPEKFVKVINQIWHKKKIEQQKIQLEAAARVFRNQEKKIILKTADSVHVVHLDNIVRCEADINYTTFHFKDNGQLLVSKTLKEFENLLSDHGFFRSHKAHLINTNYIKRVDRKRLGHVVLTDGNKVPLAIRKREVLIKLLESSYGLY